MGCFNLLLLAAAAIGTMLTLLRWFEQTADAVDAGDWNRTTLLIFFPPLVWTYASRVSAGRPIPVPRHEPVRGFGSVPLTPKDSRPVVSPQQSLPTPASPRPFSPSDQPPPGTPKEFLGMPVIPPKKKVARSAPDPEKLARLRQKMKDQGMLDE